MSLRTASAEVGNSKIPVVHRLSAVVGRTALRAPNKTLGQGRSAWALRRSKGVLLGAFIGTRTQFPHLMQICLISVGPSRKAV